MTALLAGNPRRRIALLGAVHAGESGPELLIPALERLLEDCRERHYQGVRAVLQLLAGDSLPDDLYHTIYIDPRALVVPESRSLTDQWRRNLQ